MTKLVKSRLPLLLASGLLVLSGCASYGAARIQSIPPGAEVVNLEDDSLLGTTPVLVHWKTDRQESRLITVRFQKAGFNDKVTAFWVNMRHNSRETAEQDPQNVKIELEQKN
jgi:hypothetical protein